MATSYDLRAALGDGFQGSIVLPGDDDYDQARSVWNGVIDKRPGIIACCETTADVQKAVAFAREHRLEVAIRGAGHNVAGSAVNDGGIVIDLGRMRAVRVDVDGKTAWAQAGATWGDVDAATTPHGLAVSGGVVSTTGIAGLTLGGGYSGQRRRDGMTIDNLISAEVVLADGRVVQTCEREHPDLFWALRGGRETLGVVTSFEYRAQEVQPELLSMHCAYRIEDIDAVFAAYRELCKTAPDELSAELAVWTIPPLPGLPEGLPGTRYVGVVGHYHGPIADGERVLAPYREIAEPLADFTHVGVYVYEQQAMDALFADGRRYFWKSLYCDELADDALAIVKRRALEAPSPSTLVIIRHLGGAIGRVDADATAFGDRSAQFLVSIDSTWDDPAGDDENIAYTRTFHEELLPYSDGRSYVNFASDGGDEAPSRVKEIKAQYDPEGVF